MDPLPLLGLLLLHWTGKAVWHVLDDQGWAKVPLVRGLQITDFRHAGSFVESWPFTIWLVVELDISWWLWGPMALACAAPWAYLKHRAGKLKRWDYLWPVVLYRRLTKRAD